METVLHVSELSIGIHELIKSNYKGPITISGEISEFRPPKKHAYFSLIGGGTQLRCCVWSSKLSKLINVIENGIEVHVRGTLDFYKVRNECSFIVSNIINYKQGTISSEYESIMEYCRINKMIVNTPKCISKKVRSIAIITSETGAAIRDIRSVFETKSIPVDIYIFNSDVQGLKCVDQCLEQLSIIQQFTQMIHIDLVIITRGGGSDTDLGWFNSIELCKGVYKWRLNSPIPIISAIGHEKDHVILDDIVDYNMGTPSIAADFVIQKGGLDREQYLQHISTHLMKMKSYAARILDTYTRRMDIIKRSNKYTMEHITYSLDNMNGDMIKLQSLLKNNIDIRMKSIKEIRHIRYLYLDQQRQLQHVVMQSKQLLTRIKNSVQFRMNNLKGLYSITSILEQGFVAIIDSDGKLLTNIKDGSRITMITKEGQITGRFMY